MRGAWALAAALVLAASGAGAHDRAAGRVDDERRQPVVGAVVTVADQDGRRSTTVYTDTLGRFVLPELAQARYDLRVRHPRYRELVRPGIRIGPETALALRVESERDPAALAAHASPSRWLGLLLPRLSSDAHREELLRQCTFCHQLGNAETRAARDAGAWSAILARMASMGGDLSPQLAAELPAAASAAFDPDTAAATLAAAAPPRTPPDAAAAVTEWVVGEPGTTLRDLAAAPDGTIWAIDMMRDRLHRFDPTSGATASWEVPNEGAPLGGDFAAAGLRLPEGASARSGPESLRITPDGVVWVTLAYRKALARFDPATASWTIAPAAAGPAGGYPQILRVDSGGRLWYTLALRNAVVTVDPTTRAQRRFSLPARSWLQGLFAPGGGLRHGLPLPIRSRGADLPLPSGLDVAPDGAVWFSQLDMRRIGRIGRVDPASGRVRTYETPFPAPRALRFDGAGALWMTGGGAGVIARFDPTTEEFRTWPLPIEAPGTDLAYALDVDRRTDAVWITGTNSDTLIRFERWRETFAVFPLPTGGTAPRALAIDTSGNVWTTSAGIPPWQLAGSGARLLRLNPAANVR